MLADAVSRITSALRPDKDFIKDFVLNKTFLNGRPFSFKDHEYQELILEEITNPDVQLVIQKPSQMGVTEVIIRGILAWEVKIAGFSATLAYPSAALAIETMKTRVDPVISSSPELSSMISKEVDSSTSKMFMNNSIMYAIGASPTAKFALVNRPMRLVVVDEVARADLKIVSALRSRQRHQPHKPSILFSTPLFEEADIDFEMGKCGVIWRRVLKCNRCGKHFFPEVFDHIRIPGFDENLRLLTSRIVEQRGIEISEAYLQCPHCERAASPAIEHTEWVDVAEEKRRPKRGIKLGAFDAPNLITVPNIVEDWLAYEDKVEFTQQVCGLPASKKNTALDVSQVTFESQEPGFINVFGLDVGKISWMTVGTVVNSLLFIHTVLPIKLKELDEVVVKTAAEFRCLCGVIDYMPYTDKTTNFVQNMHNVWAALYENPAKPTPENYKIQVKEDEALGNVRLVKIQMNPVFDAMAADLMDGTITYRASQYDDEVKAHLQAMRRIKDPTLKHDRYVWVKPQGKKTPDHIFHSTCYCRAASKLLLKGDFSKQAVGLKLVHGAKLRSDI